MARSMFTSKTPLRQATNPTGCRPPLATSYSGCACICPAKPFSRGSTRCHQSSKRNDTAYEAQTSHYVRLGHDCGVGDRHVPLRLFLAAPGEQYIQKSDRQSGVRQRPRPDQYSLYGAASALCRAPPHIAATRKLETNDRRREPRHPPYRRLARPLQRAARPPRAGRLRPLLQRAVH